MRPTTVNFVLTSTTAFLAEKEIPCARLEAELLLGFVLDLDRLRLYLQYDRPLTPHEIHAYKEVIKKRLSGQPLAYIIGKKAFLKWDFLVNPAVLIPRPETELLVEKTVETLTDLVPGIPLRLGAPARPSVEEIPGATKKIAAVGSFDEIEETGQSGVSRQIRLLELGTGSGIIAVSLALYLPEVYIDAVDISSQAIDLAEKNAERLGVGDRITFFTGDLFAPLPPTAKEGYLGIISNPPYIPSAVIPTLSREVRTEPVNALDGGVDGLDFYKRIIASAGDYLTQDGFLGFEHGHDQYPCLDKLARNAGYNNIKSYRDLAEYKRVLICSR